MNVNPNEHTSGTGQIYQSEAYNNHLEMMAWLWFLLTRMCSRPNPKFGFFQCPDKLEPSKASEEEIEEAARQRKKLDEYDMAEKCNCGKGYQ